MIEDRGSNTSRPNNGYPALRRQSAESFKSSAPCSMSSSRLNNSPTYTTRSSSWKTESATSASWPKCSSTSDASGARRSQFIHGRRLCAGWKHSTRNLGHVPVASRVRPNPQRGWASRWDNGPAIPPSRALADSPQTSRFRSTGAQDRDLETGSKSSISSRRS